MCQASTTLPFLGETSKPRAGGGFREGRQQVDPGQQFLQLLMPSKLTGPIGMSIFPTWDLEVAMFPSFHLKVKA